jgi:predicted  nucleic acid-binding Zn-ribbon protein
LLQEKRKFEKEKLYLENQIVDFKSRLDSSSRIGSQSNKNQTSSEIVAKYAALQVEVDNTKNQIKVLKDLNTQLQKDLESLQRSEGAELLKAYIAAKLKEADNKQKLKTAARAEIDLREQLSDKDNQIKELLGHTSEDHSTIDSSNSTNSSSYDDSTHDLR